MDRLERMREVVKEVDVISEKIEKYKYLLSRFEVIKGIDSPELDYRVESLGDGYSCHYLTEEMTIEVTKCTIMILKDLIDKNEQKSKEILNSIYGKKKLDDEELTAKNMQAINSSVVEWSSKCVYDIRESSKDYVDTDSVKVVKKDGATGDIYRIK